MDKHRSPNVKITGSMSSQKNMDTRKYPEGDKNPEKLRTKFYIPEMKGRNRG